MLVRKAWDKGSFRFRDSEISVFPNLTRATLQRRAILKPLRDAIHVHGGTYRWGYPFHLLVRKEDVNFALHHPYELPLLFDFLEMDPIQVPNWLAPIPPHLDATEAQVLVARGKDPHFWRGSGEERPDAETNLLMGIKCCKVLYLLDCTARVPLLFWQTVWLSEQVCLPCNLLHYVRTYDAAYSCSLQLLEHVYGRPSGLLNFP